MLRFAFAAGHPAGFAGTSTRKEMGNKPPKIQGPGTAIRFWMSGRIRQMSQKL